MGNPISIMWLGWENIIKSVRMDNEKQLHYRHNWRIMILVARHERFKINLISEKILKTNWGLLRLFLMERECKEESTCVDILFIIHICYSQGLLYKINCEFQSKLNKWVKLHTLMICLRKLFYFSNGLLSSLLAAYVALPSDVWGILCFLWLAGRHSQVLAFPGFCVARRMGTSLGSVKWMFLPQKLNQELVTHRNQGI